MEKTLCPCCSTNNVITEEVKHKSNTSVVYSYLCVKCGYSSNSLFTIGSESLNSFFTTNDKQLVVNLNYFDESTGLYWFPVIFLHVTGALFPEGTVDNWYWAYVPIIKIEEDEKEKYGTEYKTRFAVDKMEKFDKLDFLEACKKLFTIDKMITVD